mmetsp:Transcript_19547/g.55081  ORF Transcript_19547/g.55081 Transcript_19547/m.55081 type:complete len:240 (+) Transcript_19547:191-910(+)
MADNLSITLRSPTWMRKMFKSRCRRTSSASGLPLGGEKRCASCNRTSLSSSAAHCDAASSNEGPRYLGLNVRSTNSDNTPKTRDRSCPAASVLAVQDSKRTVRNAFPTRSPSSPHRSTAQWGPASAKTRAHSSSSCNNAAIAVTTSVGTAPPNNGAEAPKRGAGNPANTARHLFSKRSTSASATAADEALPPPLPAAATPRMRCATSANSLQDTSTQSAGFDGQVKPALNNNSAFEKGP